MKHYKQLNQGAIISYHQQQTEKRQCKTGPNNYYLFKIHLLIVILNSPAQKSKFCKIIKNPESFYHLALILLLNPENITTFEKNLQEQWTVLSTWCKTLVSAEIDSQQPGAANTVPNPQLTARVNWWKPIGQPQILKPYAKVSAHFREWLPES